MSVNGLRPYPAYQESDVRWMGMVPNHWRLVRAKWLFTKMDRPVSPSDGVVTCFRDGTVTLRKNRRELGFTESLKEIGYQGVRRGDLVIHAMDAFAGACGISDSDGKSTPVYSVCTPKDERVSSRYYAFCVREMARSRWIMALSRGVRERSTDFRFAAFGNQLVPAPSGREQRAIVRFLDEADRRIRRYIHAKERLIELLEERKRTLVHAAVTGRIDVRTGRPYPAYRDSNVQWLGNVPEHWEVRRLKTFSHMQSGEAITAMSIAQTGECRVFGGNGHRGFTSSYTHDGEFALIGRQGALCGNVHLARGRFWASEHAVVATLRHGHVLEWFGALLEVMNLNQYSIAAAQPGLSVDRVMNLWAPVPPPAEQVAISQSLVERGRDMESAVVTTKRRIVLLQEYRTRLIADVVTGKLDVREAAADLLETDPLPVGDRSDSIDPESNPQPAKHDMVKEVYA